MNPERRRRVVVRSGASAIVANVLRAGHELAPGHFGERIVDAIRRDGTYDASYIRAQSVTGVLDIVLRRRPDLVVLLGKDDVTQQVADTIRCLLPDVIVLRDSSKPVTKTSDLLPKILSPFYTCYCPLVADAAVVVVGYQHRERELVGTLIQKIVRILRKIAEDLPKARVIIDVEGDPSALEKQILHEVRASHALNDLVVESVQLPTAKDEIVEMLGSHAAIIFQEDGEASQRLYDIASYALVTERPVINSYELPMRLLDGIVPTLGQVSLAALMQNGAASSTAAIMDFGEWSFMRTLHEKVADQRHRHRFSGMSTINSAAIQLSGIEGLYLPRGSAESDWTVIDFLRQGQDQGAWTTLAKPGLPAASEPMTGARAALGRLLHVFANLLRLDDEDYVQALYGLILRRPADPEGLTVRLKCLAEGAPRGAVMGDLLVSGERLSLRARLASAKTDFARLTETLIELPAAQFAILIESTRTRAPIAEEHKPSRLNTLFDAAVEHGRVEGGPRPDSLTRLMLFELSLLLGRDDQSFVDAVYALVLRRAADPVGYADHLHLLGAGDTRAAIIIGMLLSPERKLVEPLSVAAPAMLSVVRRYPFGLLMSAWVEGLLGEDEGAFTASYVEMLVSCVDEVGHARRLVNNADGRIERLSRLAAAVRGSADSKVIVKARAAAFRAWSSVIQTGSVAIGPRAEGIATSLYEPVARGPQGLPDRMSDNLVLANAAAEAELRQEIINVFGEVPYRLLSDSRAHVDASPTQFYVLAGQGNVQIDDVVERLRAAAAATALPLQTVVWSHELKEFRSPSQLGEGRAQFFDPHGCLIVAGDASEHQPLGVLPAIWAARRSGLAIAGILDGHQEAMQIRPPGHYPRYWSTLLHSDYVLAGSSELKRRFDAFLDDIQAPVRPFVMVVRTAVRNRSGAVSDGSFLAKVLKKIRSAAQQRSVPRVLHGLGMDMRFGRSGAEPGCRQVRSATEIERAIAQEAADWLLLYGVSDLAALRDWRSEAEASRLSTALVLSRLGEGEEFAAELANWDCVLLTSAQSLIDLGATVRRSRLRVTDLETRFLLLPSSYIQPDRENQSALLIVLRSLQVPHVEQPRRPVQQDSNTAATPLLSICVSTYNRAQWLRLGLKSLIHQVSLFESSQIEILVVDNASTDDTPDAAAPFGEHPGFRFVRNASNVGMLGNLAVAAQLARGQYVWILGDDDFLIPGALAKIVNVLRIQAVELVALNYGFVSFTDPSEVTSMESLTTDFNILEPQGPDKKGTVVELAPLSENFYTAIYSHIYRRGHAILAYTQDTQGRAFSSLLTCVPTSYYTLIRMAEACAYWVGKPALVVNSNVSWQRYGTLFDLEQLPRVWDLAVRAGADRAAVDSRMANRLWLVEMMWKEILREDLWGNRPYTNMERIIGRLRHLPSFAKHVPVMKAAYSEAYDRRDPVARIAPDELFAAWM